MNARGGKGQPRCRSCRTRSDSRPSCRFWLGAVVERQKCDRNGARGKRGEGEGEGGGAGGREGVIKRGGGGGRGGAARHPIRHYVTQTTVPQRRKDKGGGGLER